MCNQSAILRLNDIQNRLNNILEICKDYGGVVAALEDTKIAQPAIIMHLIVCNENLQKIQSEINALDIFTSEEIRGLKSVRNIASHDYDGLNLVIIEKIIRESLPSIIERLNDFFDENSNQNNIRRKK